VGCPGLSAVRAVGLAAERGRTMTHRGKGMAKTNEKPAENYLVIPNSVLNIRGLGRGEKLLLAHIHSFGRKGCWENNATLGKMFFVSTRTVSMWVANLKEGGHILWLHPKGYYRTLWAKSHPEVKATQSLFYRDGEISKAEVISGQAKSTLLRKNLPSECAENCEVTAQKDVFPLRKKLLQTNNTTMRDTNKNTVATPAPLPAGGQAPALLHDRKVEQQGAIEQFKTRFGSTRGQHKPLSAAEFERSRQKLRKQLLAEE